MVQQESEGDLFDYCRLTGRTPSTDKADLKWTNRVRNAFLPLTGAQDLAPSSVLLDDHRYEAFYLSGDWSGILIDRVYLHALKDVAKALVHGEHCVHIAHPLIKVIADRISESGREGLALMVRHERLSELYVLEEMENSIRSMVECPAAIDQLESLKELDDLAWLDLCHAYILLHETGHWIFTEHRHHGALAKIIDDTKAVVAEIQALYPDQAFKKRAQELGIDLDKTPLGGSQDNIVEEVFCDRFTSGALFARFAQDNDEPSSWRNAFMAIRCIQESKRLLQNSLDLADDVVSGGALLDAYAARKWSVLDRGFSPLYLRSYVTSSELRNFVPAIYRAYGKPKELDADEIRDEGKELNLQSMKLFATYAGPSVERCLALVLKACTIKSEDKDVSGFFERLARRYRVTSDEDVRDAFDRAVDSVSEHLDW